MSLSNLIEFEKEAVRALALLEKEELRQKIRKLQAELDRLA